MEQGASASQVAAAKVSGLNFQTFFGTGGVVNDAVSDLTQEAHVGSSKHAAIAR